MALLVLWTEFFSPPMKFVASLFVASLCSFRGRKQLKQKSKFKEQSAGIPFLGYFCIKAMPEAT
jgi:hypothetical protein